MTGPPQSRPEHPLQAEVLDVVYTELRLIASSMMRKEKAGHTLQTTALVHEAYLRLAASRNLGLENRALFFSAAATAMRRILIESARSKKTSKRDGGERLPLTDLQLAAPLPDDQLLLLDAALHRLSALDARQAHIVELRFFAGLSNAEIATTMGMSERTVKREWALARAWLRGEMIEA